MYAVVLILLFKISNTDLDRHTYLNVQYIGQQRPKRPNLKCPKYPPLNPNLIWSVGGQIFIQLIQLKLQISLQYAIPIENQQIP